MHPPGVGALLKRIGELELANIRIVEHDAVEVLDHMLAPSPDASPDGFSPKPSYRPLTKFENRGIKLGHGVYDVLFTKR